ncbi:MAG TPA: flagellar basal body L-ring protein FlgH [Rhizomicrobium sp.]|jgi:flagellar L-ring protein precursor FlgH|nr:flagellar basal body L-ring protein FlgH [Rhizomicrobium sp.]
MKKLALFALAAATLGGCSTMDRLENIGKAPDLAPIQTQVAIPAAPAPAAGQIAMTATPPPTYPTNSLWQQDARSFFHDPRASRIGDLLTVNVSVADAAQIQDTTQRSRTNSDNANLTNFFGLDKAITSAGADPSSLVKMGSATSNVGAGSVNRSETINLTLAAVVAQVLPNGNLIITGHQQVRVNNELRDLSIGGIVRPEDITNANTIDLAQIAEARVSYGGKGQITDVQQPRLGSQLYDILMPF